MQKEKVVTLLKEMADLLEITDANAFEVRAHRNAAQNLDEWSGDIQQAAESQTLTEIPGVGKGLAQVIGDLAVSDSSAALDEVRQRVPPQLPQLLRIRGLGPKRVRTLWRELDIESPADLKKAADEGSVQTLRGFGAKTVERLLTGLERLESGNAPARKARPDATKVRMPQAPAANGRLWVGTSGFSYAEWKGGFYPEDAKTARLLEHYAERLETVEINNTFYRFPSEKVIKQWSSQTPEHFRFAVKAHQRITHQYRLNEAARDLMVEFVERCGQLGERLGCVLFQLPPNFARDDEKLERMLDILPEGSRYAIEFRHPSWLTEETASRLRKKNVACVAGDSEKNEPSHHVTADFVYARLRRSSYSPQDLNGWDQWFQEQRAEQHDVLAYFKHDETGAMAEGIASRWATPQPTAARERLRETLAKSDGEAQKTTKRRRKRS